MALELTKSGITDWALRLVIVLILGMAVPPKFAADPAAVAMFTQLDAEPFGRLATGVFESLAVVLLLVPGAMVFGALLAAGLMSGAMLAHIVILGIAPGGDASMFALAVVAFVASALLVWRRRTQIPVVGQFGRADEAAFH